MSKSSRGVVVDSKNGCNSVLCLVAYEHLKSLVLSGETYEDKKARRLEMLNTSKEDLLKCADTVDRRVECGGAVVLGGKEKLDAFGDAFDRVIEI